MIYTVTFNPAIDYVVQVEELKKGSIHRSISEIILCGGKGINVSLVLAEFGIRSKALGFIAGFTGKEIERMVREQGVETDFVELENGCSRINIKLRSLEKESGETDINGQGPTILEEEVQQLYNKLDKLKEGDLLILAGSVPNSLPDSIYEKILTRISGKGIRVIVDAAKDLLRNVLKYQPFLIKPNHNELEELFGVTLKTSEDIVEYASKLKEMGAKNVLVSMAENGAVLLDENGQILWCNACKGTVKNSVGAGDSMVAGFVAGMRNGDYKYALKLGTAAGGAAAFSDGLAKKDKIFALLEQLS